MFIRCNADGMMAKFVAFKESRPASMEAQVRHVRANEGRLSDLPKGRLTPFLVASDTSI